MTARKSAFTGTLTVTLTATVTAGLVNQGMPAVLKSVSQGQIPEFL